MGCALGSLGHSLAYVIYVGQQRPLGAEMWSSEKVNLGGSQSACSTALLVDQSYFYKQKMPRGRIRANTQKHVLLIDTDTVVTQPHNASLQKPASKDNIHHNIQH